MNIGILGLGVMGRSLALNFERNGYSVAGFDLNLKFDNTPLKDKNIQIFDFLDELVRALDKPRCILIMIPAGKAVDKAITSVRSHLEKDDIIIDGGNSFFMDTERRIKHLSEEGIHFVGMGVSVGERGALQRAEPYAWRSGVSMGASEADAGIHLSQSRGWSFMCGMDGQRRRGTLRQDGA